ncbi:MAG: hypothetical protein R6X19_07555 [Kiritimatiellia bacterium]
MNSVPDKKPPDAESEVWNAIAAFERILEVMPDDRTSLDTLVHAYIQLGDHTRALEYLLRLAKVVADERDAEAAAPLLEHLQLFAEMDPSIKALIDRLQGLVKGSPASGPEKTAVPAPGVAKSLLTRKANISDELALAWDLLEAEELTQEQYAEVVQDLTNISSNTLDKGVVSMLHVIDQRGYAHLDRILGIASRKGDVPIINLSNFELNDEAVFLLPVEFMIRQGVLPFDLLGPDVLIVIQNPYDRDLRKQLEQNLGRRCHFFLASPHEFNQAIGRVQKKIAEAAATVLT